jgi:selenocysteine-specific elongation factor
MAVKEHVIISTAGHIDHGKTALIKALTGIDADTLPEEKKRGMTIDLGFVFMPDPEAGKQIVFIDVPGHEKFIKTMVAGAANVEAALLVIAADEGVNVQTKEHFDILRLLRIPTGLIALTKIDLVTPEIKEKRLIEIKALVQGSFLEGTPVIPVSARSGEGIEALKQALRELAQKVKPRFDTGVFRLPIDRVFSLPGLGTIVAGTLLSGEVKVGDRVKVYPEELEARVRAIHVQHVPQEKSRVGLRTALNIPDLKKEQLRRGQVIAHPGNLNPTVCLDAWLELLPGAQELKNRERVHLHLGTDEICGRVSLLDRGILKPGESGPVQLFLETPAAALPGDRFVLRTFSPCYTIGGGQVLDVAPPKHRRFEKTVLVGIEKLMASEPEMVEEIIRRSGSRPVSVDEVAQRLGWLREKVRPILASLVNQGTIVAITEEKDLLYTHQENLISLQSRLKTLLDKFFQTHPHLPFMPLVELRSQFLQFSSAGVLAFLIKKMTAEKIITVEENKVSLLGRTIQLTKREAELLKQIEQAYLRAQFTPPLEAEVQKQLRAEPGLFKKAVQHLYREGILVRLNQKVTFHRETWQNAEQFVRGYLRARGKITIAELRDCLRLTRKFACAILEYMDRRGITKRVGDEHVLK